MIRPGSAVANQSHHTDRRLSTFESLSLLVIFLLGFALRIHALEGQSMWSDEGLSLYRAEQNLQQIFKNVITVDGIDTQDTSPPFYFLLLHLWRSAAGKTIFAMRYLGAVAGALSVPLMYALGRLGFGRRAGFVAALFMAISPFHVWQSQILRNYSLLILPNLISVYALLRFATIITRTRRATWLVIWLVTGLLGIYTHYFGFFVFAFGLVTLGSLGVRGYGAGRLFRQRWTWFALILGLLVTLPAILIALDRFQAGPQFDFFVVPLDKFIYQALSAFGVGMEPSLTHPWWRLMPAVILAMAGIIFGWLTRRQATMVLLGYLFIPLGLLLSLSVINPLFNGTRHLLIGLPPFLLFSAAGAVGATRMHEWPRSGWARREWNWISFGLAALLVIVQVSWLRAQFSSPRLIRDDVRAAALYLNNRAQADEIVILHDSLIKFTFDYYYRGQAPVIAIPAYGRLDTRSAIQALEEAGRGKARIWFLTKPEPRDGFDRQLLVDWADMNWHLLQERLFPNMWLRLALRDYLPDPQNRPELGLAKEFSSSWPGVSALQYYDIPAEVIPDQPWWLTLYLDPAGISQGSFRAALRLTDTKGEDWIEVDQLIEPERVADQTPTEYGVAYHLPITVPAGLPPGAYQLWLSLVDANENMVLPNNDGHLEVRLLDVSAPMSTCSGASTATPAVIRPFNQLGQEIALLGYNSPVGEYRPGQKLVLDLWWCALEKPSEAYSVRLQLLDPQGQVIAESYSPMTRADFPPVDWEPGELIMGHADIVLPASLQNHLYELRLSVMPTDSNSALPIDWPLGPRSVFVGNVAIEPWEMDSNLPEIVVPLRADFGEPPLVEFHGYVLFEDMVRAGQWIKFTLYWRSLADNMTSSYIVLSYLVDKNGQVVAVSEGVPGRGLRPTTGWREQEVIPDLQAISIPATLEPGEYDLSVGLYDPETDRFLPILVNGLGQSDDRLSLTTVTVAP